MEITLESVQKNKEKYNENIKKILQDRADLMKQVTELRRTRKSLTDEVAIAKLDFEEAKLVQQINDLTSIFKGNKLTLEQLGLQQNVLEAKIDKETYSKGMVENRKAKANLSNEQELFYCKDEVTKCQMALRLYTLIGDKENINKWRKALEDAQKSLEYAQVEVNKEMLSEEKTSTTPAKENDTLAVENSTPQEGYAAKEYGNIFIKQQQQVLKDYSGKEMGSRTITWNTNIENGTEEIETVGLLENDDEKCSMKEVSRGVGNELQFHRKELNSVNKTTGEKEQYVYQKDEKGNETYFKTSNGKTSFRITKSSNGITIDNYENGQLIESFEYDKDGKAIEGMGMADIDQLDENYVENFFDSQVPYFEAENREIPMQNIENNINHQTLLDSAIEATEETTRTSTINKQVENMKDLTKEKNVKSKGMEIE